MMAKTTKTKETALSVDDLINNLDNHQQKDATRELLELFSATTGFPPRVWGSSIIGFGSYHYKYQSGHEGDAPLAGFSPRSSAISIYLCSNFPGRPQLLEKLGKYKSAKSCIYIKQLKDVDSSVLREMISCSVRQLQRQYPAPEL